jgi:hypothetical protein
VDSVSTLKQVQAEITTRMRRGDAFAAIEEEVINASALSEAEKSALWLYGWSFVHWQRQRREALAHLDHLASESHALEPTLDRPRGPRPQPRRALRQPSRR